MLHPARVQEPKEYNNDSEREARIERRAESHGVFAPPGIGAALDDIVEEIANNGPYREIKPRGRGNPGHGAKYDGEVHFSEDTAALVASV